MKKLLALLLALIMCFGVFVACDEEEPSSEGTSDLTLVGNEEPSVDKGSSPVFPSVFENKYVCYNIIEKQSLWYNGTKEDFQRWIFADRVSFISFLQENTELKDSSEITEKTFEENFVVVIYRSDDVRETENYAYGNFKWIPADEFYREDGYYSITLEYTSYGNKNYDEWEKPPSFDIIVVPREDSWQDPSNIAEELRILTYVHKYEVQVEVK